MSGIPSDIAGSALQAGFQARQVGRVRDADRAGQAQAANKTARAVDEAGSTVETTDSDTQVFADAEGTGSKGRSFEEDVPEQREEESAPPDDASGIIRTSDGQLHLDLEA